MPSTIETEISRVLHAHLEAGIDPKPGKVDAFMHYISDDYTGIGTGTGEFMRSRDVLHTTTLKEQEQMQYAVRFEVQQFFVRILRPDLVLAEGEFQLEIDVETHMHLIDVRFSTLFEQRSGQWLIIHSHYSTADAMLEEGGTLMEALQARNAELEKEVAQRTAALNQSLEDLKAAQAQLIHQEKMASLGQLTAGIAHEIKNPLNFINNFAGLNAELFDDLHDALKDGDMEEVEALLSNLRLNAGRIETHGRRADAIVHAMMQHTSGRSGRRTATDLNGLVSEHIDLAYHGRLAQVSDFNVEIKRDLDTDAGDVEVVPQEIGQVLLNLLGNAFDAVQEKTSTSDGSYRPAVKVTMHKVDGQVVIQIADNGPGIAQEVRSRIFEPFFTTKPAGTGTGLGLSLSYDIITQGHGGTLTVESEEGQGATFIITLPVHSAETASSS